MKVFELTFEGRLQGAIGVFYKITQKCNAVNEEKAKGKIRKNYETNCFYSCKDVSEYQGWTNSKTWSAAYLTNQEPSIYKNLTHIKKHGMPAFVSGQDVKAEFERIKLKCDSWTIGAINWQEIADTHYNID